MIEYLPFILTGLGLMASIIYYTSVLRNANKTRQTQLLQNMINQMNQPELWTNFGKLIWDYEWTDYDEFMDKYGPINNPSVHGEILSVMAFFNGLGVLVATGRVDAELLGMHLGEMPVMVWEKVKSVVDGARVNNPVAYGYFEYLKEERIRAKKGLKGKAAYLNEKLYKTSMILSSLHRNPM